MEESISYHNTKVYIGNCDSSYWYKSYILHCTGEGPAGAGDGLTFLWMNIS